VQNARPSPPKERMTLSRIGLGASLSLVIFTVWLGACTSSTQACGNDGNLNGTCESVTDGGGGCPSGTSEINTSDSLATGCPTTYLCCGTILDSGETVTPASTGVGSGS